MAVARGHLVLAFRVSATRAVANRLLVELHRMLPVMPRRVPPLAVAIVLVAAGLVATAWSMRRTVNEAFEAVRDGQAFTLHAAVRADLADLGAPPTSDDLAAIVRDHARE